MKLINQSNVRKLLLEQAAQTRAHKFSRVSNGTLTAANEHLRQWIVNHVKSVPSAGKTL